MKHAFLTLVGLAAIGVMLMSHRPDASVDDVAAAGADTGRHGAGAGTAANAVPPVANTDCSGQYIGGQAPAIVAERMRPRTTPLCFQRYSVMFSGLTRTPLWSAERLTRAAALAGSVQQRVDVFYEEDRIPPGDRSLLDDYRGSGFDRGHMTPSADMPDAAAQAESFSLANMVPQAPRLNRYAWADLERGVRHLAEAQGSVFVVTGPLYEGHSIPALKGRVYVPTSTWKAVYAPGVGAMAYVAANTDVPGLRMMSIARLRDVAGIDPFPGIPESVKAQGVDIVHGSSSGDRGSRRRSYGQGMGFGGQRGFAPDQ